MFSFQISLKKQISALIQLFYVQTLKKKSTLLYLIFSLFFVIIFVVIAELLMRLNLQNSNDYQDDDYPLLGYYDEYTRYFLQYNKNQTSDQEVQQLTSRYTNYNIISTDSNSSDTNNMENMLLQRPDMIGVGMDSNVLNKFKGIIAVGMVGISFIPMLLGLYDLNARIIFYSIPLLAQTIMGTMNLSSSLLAEGIIIFQGHIKNRIENRSMLIQLQGVSKNIYHLTQILISSLVYFIIYFICFILLLIFNSQIVKGWAGVIFIFGGLINILLTQTFGDLLSHIGNTEQISTLLFEVIEMFNTFILGLILYSVVAYIPGPVLATVLSWNPYFSLFNCIQACYNLAYLSDTYTLYEVMITKNCLLIQLIFQLGYIYLFFYFVKQADKSLIQYSTKKGCKSKNEIQKENQLIPPQYEIPDTIEKDANWFQVQEEIDYVNKLTRHNSSILTNSIDTEQVPILSNEMVVQQENNTIQYQNKLIIKDVSKGFQNQHGSIYANNHINLVAEQGQLTFILGPNGSGKTTLCKNILGCNKINSGNIYLDKTTLYNNEQYRKQIGSCLQSDEALIQEFTVGQNIQFYLKLGTDREFDDQIVKDLISKFNLDQYLLNKPDQLSGGYKRRLSLICALLRDPKVLFLDEITTGIDVQSQKEVWDLINTTTHVLKEAQDYADKVAFIINGQIRCVGKIEDIEQLIDGKTSFRVNGKITDEILFFFKDNKIEILNQSQIDQQLRVNTITVKNENRVIVFRLLQQLYQQQKINSFSISNQILEGIFYDLCQTQ